jgi:hypothetical protein
MVICQVLEGSSQTVALAESESLLVEASSVQLQQLMLKLSRALKQNPELGGPFRAFVSVLAASRTLRGHGASHHSFYVQFFCEQRVDSFGLYQSLYKSWFV